MTKEDFLKLIDSLHVQPANLNRYLKNHYPEAFDFMVNETRFLDENNFRNKVVPILARLLCIRQSITDSPKCRVCGTGFVGWNSTTQSFSPCCCKECSRKDPVQRERMMETKLKKYGSLSYNGADHRKPRDEKARVEKARATTIARYGCSNYRNPEKALQTRIENSGTLEASYKASIDKGRATKERVYGDANYNNREKFKSTLELLTDEDWKEINEKRKITNQDRFGGPAPVFDPTIKEQIFKAAHEKSFERLCCLDNEVVLLTSYEDFMQKVKGGLSGVEFNWHCSKCNTDFGSPMNPFQLNDGTVLPARCGNCHPVIFGGTSALEQEIVSFVKENYAGEVIEGDRKVLSGKELDIYLPELKLAIEVDGLFWHSEAMKFDRNYHLAKTELCESLGIHLVHVFENEWREPIKQDIVKSRLLGLMGKHGNRLFARNCSVKEIAPVEARVFLNANHLQGGRVSARVNLGLFNNDELISVMTFSKPRFNKRYEWELVRFATKKNCSVVGGAGKLFKFFVTKYRPKTVISYADRRWTTVLTNVYQNLGFSLKEKSTPRYYYVKDNKLENRVKFQKHKLPKLLRRYDPALSEVENMAANGYTRIYDCGTLAYDWSELATI